MIRLGYCAFGLRGLDLENSIRLATRCGFTVLDAGATPGSPQIDQRELAANPAAVGRRVRGLAERYGAELHELFIVRAELPDGSTPQPAEVRSDEARRMLAERMRRLYDGTLEAGFASVMIATGAPPDGTHRDEALRWTAATLAALYYAAAAAGCRLHVEPAVGSVIDTVDRVYDLHALCPELRLTLDYSHFTGAGTPLEAIYPLHELAGHIHLKPASFAEYKVPFRRNEIDFARVTRRLEEDRFAGVASAETIYEVGAPNPDENPIVQGVLVTEAARGGLMSPG